MKCIMRKPTMWFPTRSDIQLQTMPRGWIFLIQKVEEMYYPCSENKGVDQLRGHGEADQRLCFSYMQNVGFLMRRLNCMFWEFSSDFEKKFPFKRNVCPVLKIEDKPEDQWSCKRSPEICCIYQQTCLNIIENNPSIGADETFGSFF